MERTANAWVVAIGVGCLFLLAGVAGATTDAQSAGVGTPAAETTMADADNETLTQETNRTAETTVGLITGQTVTVSERDGHRDYAVEASVPMTRERIRGEMYVYPESVTFETYDRALFNVDRLAERNITAGDPIPVIVTREEGVSTATTTPGYDRSRSLGSIDGSAGTITPPEEGAFSTAGTGAGVDRIYLDRKYTLPPTSTSSHGEDRWNRSVPNGSAAGVTVAVIDSGVNESHPDLDDGTEVYEEDFTGTPDDGAELHGTHVAGIVAGDGDASDGDVTGVAPEASIMDLQVFDDGGARTSRIISAVETAVARDAGVISMSLGGPIEPDRPLVNATNWAVEEGSVVVAAAGNRGGRRTVDSPGVAARALTVGATDRSTGELADFSSQGPTPERGRLKPDIVAPGVSELAPCGLASECDTYTSKSGTSMATPHVSGVVALVRAQHPNWSPDRVRTVVESTAYPVIDDATPYDVYKQGTGLLDAREALSADLVIKNATQTMEPTGDGALSATVRVTNVGSTRKTVNASATFRDGTTGRIVDVPSVNPNSVSLDPGQTETIAVSTEQNESISLYSGRLFVGDGDQRYSVALGAASESTVTVRKTALNDSSAAYDAISLIPFSSVNTGFYPFRAATTQYPDNGTAMFETVGERALVWSVGEYEPTSTPVFTYEIVDIDGNETVILNESRTVTQTVDTDGLPEGNLTLRSVQPTAQIYVDKPGCGESIPLDNCYGNIDLGLDSLPYEATEPTARYSPSQSVNVWTEFIFVPSSAPMKAGTLGTETVYDLTYAERNVTESAVYRPTRSSLGRMDLSYFRRNSTQPHWVNIDEGPRNLPSTGGYGRWWYTGNQTQQSWFVTPNVSQDIDFSPDTFEWQTGAFLSEVEAGTNRSVTLGDHPIDPTYFRMNLTQRGGALGLSLPGRFNAPNESVQTVIRENGTVVATEPMYFFSDYAPDSPSRGMTYNLTKVYNQSTLNLSTRLVGSYRGTFQGTGDPTPPYILDIDVGERDTLSRVRTDAVPVSLQADGAQNLTLAYSTASDPSTPFTTADVEDDESWTTAETTQARPGTYTGTLELPSMRGSVHLAMVVTDGEGDTSSLLVEDAFEVDTVSRFATSLDGVTPVDGTPSRAGLNLTFTNTAAVAESTTVTVAANNSTRSVDLTVPGNSTVRRFVSLGEDIRTAGTYNATVTSGNTTNVTAVAVREPDFRLPGQDAGAQSVDDDPQLEDVDGNGETDIFDALTYYNNRDADVVENNPRQFDYDGDGEAGTLFDALTLYNEISGASN